MHIILGLFADMEQAQAAGQALLANHTTLPTANIGFVSKDPDGQTRFWETAEERELHDLSTLGHVTGWLLGLASAMVGTPFTIWQSATAGDLVATDVATWHDAGFPDQALRHLAEHLHAGSAAVVVLTPRELSRPIIATLEQSGGTVYQGRYPPGSDK